MKSGPKEAGSGAAVGEKGTQIESLTGAHTKIVWNECQTAGESDPFSEGMHQVLRGVDTRDGRGERTIVDKPGNYSRPILAADGNAILYSRREIVRKKGKKDLALTIFRTDWRGSSPQQIANGFLACAWRDPSTDVEWIYCTRKFKGHGANFVARQLWRFRSDDPKTEEMVYDDTPLSPTDNIQLSRDGRRACALIPWPKGGILELKTQPPSGRKLANGCWPSMAPDASGVMWVFHGDHRSATFFDGDGSRSWNVRFDAPCVANGEAYHPRWTNHPRFMVLTGPYTAKKAGDMALHSRGNQPDVYLGRFNERADKMEAWVQVSSPGASKGYPDAWIAGADTVNLRIASPSPQPAVAGAEIDKWTRNTEGLLFLWQNRKAPNQWKDREGKTHSADLNGSGAARVGRFGELVFDGGAFQIDEEEAEGVAQRLQKGTDATFEALISADGGDWRNGWILQAPGFNVRFENNFLRVGNGDGQSRQAAMPESGASAHLTIVRHNAQFGILVNGKELATENRPEPKSKATQEIVFGRESQSLHMEGIALYDRGLAPEEIAANGKAQLNRLTGRQAAPSQIRLRGRLVEISKVPTVESIQPYSSALICLVYEVEQVLSGEFNDKRILVKHWGLLNRRAVAGMARQIGHRYELWVERESDHPELEGERVVDDTTAFDLESWVDASIPKVK